MPCSVVSRCISCSKPKSPHRASAGSTRRSSDAGSTTGSPTSRSPAKYRLNIGSLYRNFDSIEPAVQAMQRTRNWLIAPAGALRNGISYDAAVRFRLESSTSCPAVQVTAIGSNDWTIDS
ncbi:MAG: DUF4390 domain-containing protein [Rhodocyclaceae bacterium]